MNQLKGIPLDSSGRKRTQAKGKKQHERESTIYNLHLSTCKFVAENSVFLFIITILP